jgi:hypothetical protein
VELIEENGGGLGARLKQRLDSIGENGGSGVRLRKSAKEKQANSSVGRMTGGT